MSTRGALVIRRYGEEKAIDIRSDAYPSSADVDIADLIKTTDMNEIFDILTVYDEWDMPDDGKEMNSDEPLAFSYCRCRLAVKHKKKLWVSQETADKVKNSMFCEYAYLIDLDKDELMFFVGGQTKPQEGNPFGTEPVRIKWVDNDYYPCRLAAVFDLKYIMAARSEYIAELMETAEKSKDHIYALDGNVPKSELFFPDGLDASKDYLTELLTIEDSNLRALIEEISQKCIVSKNRVNDILGAVSSIRSAVRSLARQVETIN